MNSHSETIHNPGSFEISGAMKTVLLVLIAIGVGSFGAGVATSPERAWASFVQNHFFFMSLGVGGAFFAAIQWTTNAMWSAPVRRFSEAFTAYLPVALVAFAILAIFGMHHVYPWTHAEHVQGDAVLEHKSSYLSIGFFIVRNVIAIVAWILFARAMNKNSRLQDAGGDFAYTLKNRVLGPTFLVVFALTFTMSSFDQLMSLDPHWFSTMFGVYCFAGLFYSTLASVCLVTVYLKGKGKLDGIVNDNHLHDLGKFMFAFTVFWAYIGFSQFMLIWYANLPEETGYFIRRFHGGWLYLSVFLVAGKFLTPFVLLLPRDSKRNPRILTGVGIFMLFAQWIDVLWMVQPEFFKEGPVVGPLEIGIALGFLGLFGLCVSRFLAKNNIVAVGDPRLKESVFHHHQ
jgi:hypothetical protein